MATNFFGTLHMREGPVSHLLACEQAHEYFGQKNIIDMVVCRWYLTCSNSLLLSEKYDYSKFTVLGKLHVASLWTVQSELSLPAILEGARYVWELSWIV